MLKSKIKYLAIAASIFALAACDNSGKDAGSATQGSTNTATSSSAAAPAFKGTEIKLIEGKATMQVPEAMKEQQGASDMMKMYIDPTNQHTLLVIVTPKTTDDLKSLTKGAKDAVSAQGATDLTIVKEGAVKAGNLDMEQLVMTMSAQGQKVYSCTALGLVGDKQVTLQFTAPQSKEDEFKKVVDGILSTVKVN